MLLGYVHILDGWKLRLCFILSGSLLLSVLQINFFLLAQLTNLSSDLGIGWSFLLLLPTGWMW